MFIIFINDIFNCKDIKRNNIKTKAMLLLIKKENLSTELKWLELDIFKKYINLIINDNKFFEGSEKSKELINTNFI